MTKYKSLFKILNYSFKNKDLLIQALTHTSYANETGTKDNERLEFLGDAVLELAISDILYSQFPQAEEGKLTKARACLVNETSLANLARKLELGKFILLGKGEELQGGRERNSILADTFEAILGAIYLDSKNFSQIKKIISKLFFPLLPKKINTLTEKKDYKTQLQEYTQEKFGDRPIYTLIESSGPDHAKIFKVKVILPNPQKTEVFAEEQSIKKAEQLAAKKALQLFRQK